MTILRLLATLIAAAAILAGCGDDEGPQIPRDQAAELIGQLRETARRTSGESFVCGDLADEDLPEYERLLGELPDDVDDGVRETLDDAIAHLRGLIEDRCSQQRRERDQQQQPETTPAPTTPEPTTPAPTTPEPTTPEPTTPDPTTPDPTTPDGGNGGGGDGGAAPDTGGGTRPRGQGGRKATKRDKGNRE